jgi:hypothetical protein
LAAYLDWTNDLGLAVTNQLADVLDAIQLYPHEIKDTGR